MAEITSSHRAFTNLLIVGSITIWGFICHRILFDPTYREYPPYHLNTDAGDLFEPATKAPVDHPKALRRDIFRPLRKAQVPSTQIIAKEPESAAVEAPANLFLKGTILSKKNALAIVQYQTMDAVLLTIGDSLASFVIENIVDNQIVLRYQSQKLSISSVE